MTERKPVILNVDGQEANRYVISRLLRKEGFAVEEAATGTEALRKTIEANPDLILLDVKLPDINGMEVCRRIKADERTRWTPVLHLSATYVTPEDRAMGLDTGADGYLTQPVDPPLLVATIRALLRARQAEAEARLASAHWIATFNAISHGVCLLDADGTVRQANQSMSSLLGIPLEKIIGSQYDGVFAGATTLPEAWPFERAKQTGRRESAQVEMGGRWFEITVDPMVGPDGKFAGAVRTVFDITPQKRYMEERERLLGQLESKRELLEAVLRQMPSGVIIAEAPDVRTLMSNEQAGQILGKPVPIGSSLADRVAQFQFKFARPDGRPYLPHELPLARSIATGEVVVNEEIELTREDRSHATLLANSGPILDRSGRIIAGVLAFYDVTQRKELEEELRQSQKMDAVGRLAGGVAHDFNNLLTIIGGYGQMVMDSLGPQDQTRKDIEAILEASNRASGLTRQLLTFSRRQVVQPKVLDLNRQVSRMNRMLRRVIGEDIELRTSLKAASSRIKSDPGQIEQVLLNVAVNARDAMPHGGKLSIETADVEFEAAHAAGRRPLAPGKYVMLAMSDTGTGMTAEVQSHIFEPFFTTKAKGKGTGLGLSTVYGIVKQTGGDVVVESEVGKGTTVRMYFPAAGGAARTRREREEAAPVRGGTETILVVEDEADVRRLASEMLKQQGYTVLEAGSGPEALHVWREDRDRIDLLLTDVIMPHMSGPELANELKNSKPELKVIYMSGYTGDTIARYGVMDQGNRFLQKPFTLKTLARKVRLILDESSSSGARPRR